MLLFSEIGETDGAIVVINGFKSSVIVLVVHDDLESNTEKALLATIDIDE